MEYARGAEDLLFADAIRHGRGRLADQPGNAQAWRVFSYLERGLYGRQVLRAQALFPESQLLFLKSEDLKNRTAETLEKIRKFLLIDRFSELSIFTENTRPIILNILEPDISDFQIVRNFVIEDLYIFQSITFLDVSKWPCFSGIFLKRCERKLVDIDH